MQLKGVSRKRFKARKTRSVYTPRRKLPHWGARKGEKDSAGKEEEETSAYIMSLVEKALHKKAEQTTANVSSSTATAPSSVLRSILKQAKNSKQA
jgi:hypothetical protein